MGIFSNFVAEKMRRMENIKMLGALAGDIIGSVHEFLGTKSKER